MKTKVAGPMVCAYPGGPPEVQSYVDVPRTQRLHFTAEAILLKALRHPNVVTCYGPVLVDRPSSERSGDEASTTPWALSPTMPWGSIS